MSSSHAAHFIPPRFILLNLKLYLHVKYEGHPTLKKKVYYFPKKVNLHSKNRLTINENSKPFFTVYLSFMAKRCHSLFTNLWLLYHNTVVDIITYSSW